jgi:hypothetical protein
MASIIVNQGAGPVPYELEGTVVLGSNPSCEVVLEHPTALGCRVELKPLRWGYRVVLVKGDMQLNEESCELADLEHNDTLRIGEVMVLYKQPEGAEVFAGAALPEELPELEALEEFESLEELEPLSVHEDVDDLEQLPELEALPEPSQELDVAVDRAHWKRLEALRRVREARAGSMEFFPDIAKDRVLDDSRQMEESGAAAELFAYEEQHDLADKTVKQLLDLAAVAQVETEREAVAQKEREAAERQERQAAEERAREEREEEEQQARLEAERLEQEAAEEHAREQARKQKEEADALATAELEALAELEELQEFDELEELPELVTLHESLEPQALPASVRPLPAGGVRFQRPLPPDHRAPTFLPPAQPARRSA